ncbi:predicted protein [Nematostella vectensis]|uniref:Uncharacterized protein n=1 Tax=Nematostella vectensis TaxID=45351 RepID=A7RW29_NEMVE|nr:uncharacterized protein LOC5516334 [Nematostella vectensis]EDO44340.1 predicted protein [Nematostella vectensis]|eukprot:XP_001636403.1 predicted protein [Nematostella vectensis]
MDNIATRSVSSSMRSAISANNYKNHALGKQLKTLEAERDMKLLSIQVKKDDVKFSTSPKMKVKKLKSLPANTSFGGQESVVEIESEERLRRVASANHALPSLATSTPPRTRRATLATQPQKPHSPSLPRRLLHSASSASLWETIELSLADRESQIKSPASPRLLNRRPITPTLTAKLCSAAWTCPDQVSSTTPQEVTAHRGLAIRPLSRNSPQNTSGKEKRKQSTAVFSRLYQAPEPRKRILETGGFAHKSTDLPLPPTSYRLERRRRSVSLPDLSDMLDNLRECRYLRKSVDGDDDDVFLNEKK